jgi:hypothetical protein
VNKTGKVLRIVAIVMLGMTAAMNLLGGIGTTCAAFSNNVGYRMAFIELMDYRWLYQILVVTTILVGLAGIWATVRLVRGSPNIYRDILIILLVGTILGGVQYFASMALRGKAAPANVKFYLNILTLVLFLIFRLPGVWNNLDFTGPGGKTENKTGVGLAAIVIGMLTLTIFMWAGPSHTFFNQNWTYVLFVPLILVGSGCTLWGIWLVGHTISEVFSQDIPAPEFEPAKNRA